MSMPMMSPEALLAALHALGQRVPRDAEITLAGGSALALIGARTRPTNDGDVVAAVPRLAEFATEIIVVATTLGLPPGWLNDRVQLFADILPSDYHDRRIRIGAFGRLTVHALGRLDLLLMKVVALRAQDQEDLLYLAPTPDEWSWVVRHFVRLASAGYEKNVVRARLFIGGRRVSPTGEGAS